MTVYITLNEINLDMNCRKNDNKEQIRIERGLKWSVTTGIEF